MEPLSRKAAGQLLEAYRAQLAALRNAAGGVYNLPDARFFLFGMGGRKKLIYQNGSLRDALSGSVLRLWKVVDETILPPVCTVRLETADGGLVEIREDEEAVWLYEDGCWVALGAPAPVCLPSFDDYRFGLVLRVLHQEILVNILNGRPLPNFLVYPRPWYRDGAMVAMVLRETGNLGLIRDWVMGLDDPYDHNNGNDEPDNLGQALFLLSLFTDRSHPLVERILAEISFYLLDGFISGITDGAPHPVYQTQWLKLALRALDLPDPYRLPDVSDSYAGLCWWGETLGGTDRDYPVSQDYPYLTWAEDVYRHKLRGWVGNLDYPLTWEAKASQAHYGGMVSLSLEYVDRKLAAPHTWHAAEMFFKLRTL